MTRSTKQPPTPAPAAPSEPINQSHNGFKAIALPALAAATRRKPQSRTERRAGLVLDPARYAD